ncbi:MAG: tetratricopeptide repeat protein [Limisphaerales bacterium]
MARWLCALVLLTGWLSIPAADFSDPLERRDFEAAAKAFQDLNYDWAEKGFGEFIRLWPGSPFKAEAVFRQAQARHFQKNYSGAMELLTAGLPQAGKLADQYQFWLGEAEFQAGQFQKAASTYALVVRDFPNSAHLLAAAHNEALARFRLGQRTNVIALLSAPTGGFQRAAKASPTNSLAVNGTLLLGEVLLAERQFPAAEQAVRSIEGLRVEPEVDWRRRFLLGRVLTEAGRSAEALPVATNLVRLAGALRQPAMQAESFALQGTVLEKLGELAAAVASFTNNFTTNAPAELRQRALFKAVELNLAQTNREPATIAMLELFSTQYPADPSLDLAQLTLGELRVKEFHARTGTTNAGPTNLLLIAVTNLGRVVTAYTNSPLLGRAFYQRGWCHLHLGQPAAAVLDFTAALRRLPRSEEQAVARFKLGEAQVQLGDFTNAIQNFGLVVEQYADFERVRTTYLDMALYQQLGAAIAVTNLAVADGAVRKILEWFPDSFYSDRAVLLHGTELRRLGRPAEARARFQLLIDRFPNSALAPQVHLAIARTHRQEFDWANTARKYNEWLRLFPTNGARGDVEFERAWFVEQSGGTNALTLFTNFVALYPANSNAPLAQYRVGDLYYSRGDAFDKAESSYQLLFQNTNWPDSRLKHLARLAAGRSAFQRQGYKDATNYFNELVTQASSERVPKDIQAEALFALGDTYLTASQAGVPIAEDPFGDAINAFSRITNSTHFPNSRLAPLAMGAIGNCLLQRAGKNKDARQLDLAAEAYQKAMDWPGADVETRSLSDVALGVVREKQGRPKDALNHWSNVFYGKNLRDGEEASLEQLKAAGGHLAHLREEQQEWAQAIAIHERMQQLFPPLRKALQSKIDRARQMLNGQR